MEAWGDSPKAAKLARAGAILLGIGLALTPAGMILSSTGVKSSPGRSEDRMWSMKNRSPECHSTLNSSTKSAFVVTVPSGSVQACGLKEKPKLRIESLSGRGSQEIVPS